MMEPGPPSLKCTSKATLGFASHASVAVTSGVGMPFVSGGGMPFAHSSVTSAGTPESTGAVLSGSHSENPSADKNTDSVTPNKVVDKHFISNLLM
jgi:hypothetical protein